MAHYVQNDKPQEMLTAEEVQTMKKCITTSFWTHSTPAALASVALLKFLDTKGHKFKLWVKASFVISAAVIGRFAAIPACVQFVVDQVPEGNLAKQIEDLRSKRGKNRDLTFASPSESEEQTRASYYDSSISRPPPPAAPFLAPAAPGHQQTYDDLRRKNREDYISRRTSPSSPDTSRGPAPTLDNAIQESLHSYDPIGPSVTPYYDPPSPYSDPLTSQAVVEEEPKFRRPKRVNKYGDEVED